MFRFRMRLGMRLVAVRKESMFQSKKRAILTVVVTALVALLVAVAAFLYFSGLGALLWFVINLEGETPQPEFAQRLADSGLVVHTIGESRPATLVLPAGHDPQSPLPLLLAFHGFSGYASMMDEFFEIPSRVNTKGFALILADGTLDDDGNRFWNATGLCCGRTETTPDDVAYISGLVKEAKTFATIDRTYSMGYSNGGFMSYRLACESLPGLAGIASIAGSSFDDPARCDGATPVSVLQVHGDEDEVIKIDGGSNPDLGPGSHPAASELVARWAQRAGCDMPAESLPAIGVSRSGSGTETTIRRYRDGCLDGVTVEFWTVAGASHYIIAKDDFIDRVLDWLFAQGDGAQTAR